MGLNNQMSGENPEIRGNLSTERVEHAYGQVSSSGAEDDQLPHSGGPSMQFTYRELREIRLILQAALRRPAAFAWVCLCIIKVAEALSRLL
jgi:hypothetical protein